MRTGLRVSAIAVVIAAVAVIVAGCGGSSGASSSTGASSNAARETAFLNYAQCMRLHGVAVSDPTAQFLSKRTRLSASRMIATMRVGVSPRAAIPKSPKRSMTAAIAT